jgi:hypothetical protein
MTGSATDIHGARTARKSIALDNATGEMILAMTRAPERRHFFGSVVIFALQASTSLRIEYPDVISEELRTRVRRTVQRHIATLWEFAHKCH